MGIAWPNIVSDFHTTILLKMEGVCIYIRTRSDRKTGVSIFHVWVKPVPAAQLS